ncbi:MAG: hypothetical protein Crog4KO_07170 [Crocinitomicaceae bacterium]
MKNLRFLFFALALTLFHSNSSHAQSDSSTLNLVGLWQGIPFVGSGWSTNYQFFDDGSFRYNHNQMDCADSVISESGNYHFEEGILYLDYDSITFISGGTYVPATGSCGSEFELVGGIRVTQATEKSEGVLVEEVEPLTDYDYLDRILLDDDEWFRMLHDPNDY